MRNFSRVLVTGGAGYIGSHACKALAHAGYVPITYDNLARGHEWAVKWGPLEKGDLLDRPRLADAISKHKPAAVIHFAALAYVGESVEDPAKYYLNNVVGTLNLLDAMRAAGLSALVFSSSCATYGIPSVMPITEQAPQNPINPYGASKLMIERILADYESAYGLRSVALRYFNAAGADPDGELGEAHEPETHLIPLVLDAALGRRAEVTVFGDDYDTPDGTCVRDYVHVSDLADAHVLAMQALQGNRGQRTYNLGMGRGYSVSEVIATARKLSGRDIPVRIGARRPGDPAFLVADASLAQRDLGWASRYSGLAKIVETAWTWTTRSPEAQRCLA